MVAAFYFLENNTAPCATPVSWAVNEEVAAAATRGFISGEEKTHVLGLARIADEHSIPPCSRSEKLAASQCMIAEVGPWSTTGPT